MAEFIFNDERIPFDEVQERSGKDFQSQVLNFASEWLSHKNEFEFHTSGSTGDPKKIIFTRNQILASAHLTIKTFNLKEGGSALLCLEPTFVAGRMMIVRAIENRMNLICIPPSANPLENLQVNEIDFAAFVPYQLEAIVQNESTREKLNHIKKIIIGGAPVSKDLHLKLLGLRTAFYETYGMTETLTHVAIRKLDPSQDYFQLLSGIEINRDSDSCLTISALHLSKEPIQTNDVVELIDKRSFKLLGRRDNIINTGGLKVQPERIEEKLTTLMRKTFGDAAYIISWVADTAFGQKLVLIIETSIVPFQKEAFLNSCREILAKWEVPKDVLFIDSFIKTTSGKVNRELTRKSIYRS